ncbi:MAG: hypothetical protein JWM68_128 [Verrucomicrobiales bacterium]|nr:hypothetical protein [Verrucomicrobiales bacterium]
MKRRVLSFLFSGFAVLSTQFSFGQSLPSVSSGTLRLWLTSDSGVVTNANGGVEQWQDQGPDANSAFQSDTNKQPRFVANLFNGKPALRFDGIQTAALGDVMQGFGSVGLNDAYTFFIVFSRSGPTGSAQALSYVGIPGEYSAVRGSYLYNGDEMAFSGWVMDRPSGFHVPTNSCHVQTQRLNAGKGQVDFFDWDGTNQFTSSATVSGLLDPGAGYYLGGLGGLTEDFKLNAKADIAEIIYYNGALSQGDQLAVQDYLQNKYISSALPEIIFQTGNQYVVAGTTASFSVNAVGARPLSYQWLFQDAVVTGATNSSFVKTNAQSLDAGTYQVIISNPAGNTTSAVVNLTVLIPIAITGQPQDQTVFAGTNVTLSVAISGDSPRYQWLFNNASIPGETNASLSLSNVQSPQGGVYSVVVSNQVSSVTSALARLSVISAPVISSQPQDFYGLAGSLITLSVGIVGAPADDVLPPVTSGSLQLWLKADVGVVTNGPGRVSQWTDQSGKVNNCSQATTTKQPTLVTNAINARPVVRFDGLQDSVNGDYLLASNNLGMTNALTSFVAYSLAPRVVGEQMLLAIGTAGGNNGLRSHYVRSIGNTTNEMAFAGWSNDYGSGYPLPTNSTRIWTIRLSTNLASIEFFDKDSSSSFSTSKVMTNLSTPASGYYVGGLGSLTRNFKGDIAEILVFRGTLGNNDRLQVEDYLSRRYLAAPQSVSYQWKIGGTNINGATNATLTLTNAQPINSGTYTVTISNIAGSITSTQALVRVRNILPYINSQLALNSTYDVTNAVSFSFVCAFTNALIFYTLDGSAPSFASQSYSGPFSVAQTALVRGIAYSSDFSQIEESDPIAINLLPIYSLTRSSPGGGTIATSPAQASFASNTLVTVTAVASNGWTFLGWSGHLSGNNPTNSFNITSNKVIQAIFGTAVSVTTAGNGSVQKYPAVPFYPYNSTMKATAVPQAGSYFGIWGNAASGNTNPLSFKVTNANPTISTLFGALGGSQASLTVVTRGDGQVSVSPQANVFTTGQTVILTPNPTAGQKFIGWGGDASGSQNPLSITMSQSKSITAVFSKAIQFTNSTFASNVFGVTLSSPFGIYSLESSSNLVNWLSIATFTNNFGDPIRFVLSTNSNQSFYRLSEP